MFYIFNSQKERRNTGGSCFIEFQFCRLPVGTKIEEIMDSSVHWLGDSLYVSDESPFYEKYSKFFDCGIYANLECGVVDMYGINYYSSDKIDIIIGKILNEKPEDHQKLVEWLEKAKEYNGFYILGI